MKPILEEANLSPHHSLSSESAEGALVITALPTQGKQMIKFKNLNRKFKFLNNQFIGSFSAPSLAL
jgi:hypothetical protein